MRKPPQAQGRKRFASLDTGSSRNVNPMRRRSRMEGAPTRQIMPKIWIVSMTGKSQRESRTAVPTGVCSSHSQNARTKCISLVLALNDWVLQPRRLGNAHHYLQGDYKPPPL